MRVGLMVGGQNGLTWERWIHILKLAERLGFPTVMRSDHYFIGRQQDSLEAYLSFAVAARETSTMAHTSKVHSKAYLRHLFKVEELLAGQIATIHNLSFFLWLVSESRRKIMDGTFNSCKINMVKSVSQRL